MIEKVYRWHNFDYAFIIKNQQSCLFKFRKY